MPAEVRASADLVEGTPLVLLDTPGGIVLMTREQLRTRVREELAGLDLIGDLLDDRRRAAVWGRRFAAALALRRASVGAGAARLPSPVAG